MPLACVYAPDQALVCPLAAEVRAERAAVWELVKAARARGDDLTGPDGLLKMVTATVLRAALEEEMTEHLGHEKHQPSAGDNGNVREPDPPQDGADRRRRRGRHRGPSGPFPARSNR